MAVRDEFFWLSKVNQATIVINSKLGLLPKPIAIEAARALREVIADGEKDPALRPKTYITFEPKMIAKSGPEITIMHAGRSSQDIHATYRAATLREKALEVADGLLTVMKTIEKLAIKHRGVVLPNYTNGVAAQPNAYSHYLIAFLYGFLRDFARLEEFYGRLNVCPMGSTVLNGTCWPLDRREMAKRLGFSGIAYNAFDATQVAQSDLPVEFSSIVTAIAIHITSFLTDLMVQYAQPRPWILLQEGGNNTYVSSAMPQKRNPGLVNNCRTEASEVIGQAQGVVFRAHNLETGMLDPKKQELHAALGNRAVNMLKLFNKVLNALVVDKERALEELNNDWTASQEVADVLMHEFGLPFRVGHHVASQMVSFARANKILPLDFPYEEMKRIYKEVIEKEYPSASSELPMSLERFKAALDPVAIINNRKTEGGPQPAEIEKMLQDVKDKNEKRTQWLEKQVTQINQSLQNLESEFNQIGE
ncbi:lyase family protein [Turicimonas muris]|uniref:lyase family protein n=1 Tax=Turicimonas muris TaxID=1796652 RepID=UPI0023F0A730|nr:lyase family protein [Turicimonas muris]